VLVEGTLRSVREHALRHELLDAAALRKRFPALEPDPKMVGVLEPRAGLLLPERCVEAFQSVARQRGAAINHGVLVEGWDADGNGVVVSTDAGEFRGDYLVLAAGPWMPDLLGRGIAPLEVERQTFHWFAPTAGHPRHGPGSMPIALWEYAPDRLVATFTDLGDGMKVGIHHEGEITHPDRVRRDISTAEDNGVRALLTRFIPSAAGALVDSAVCMYTNTPDHDFIVDWHPDSDRVLVLSPCSGHGFKFASAIGELAADMTTRGASDFDLSPFRLNRFLR
jgi:sarcosine oxidase